MTGDPSRRPSRLARLGIALTLGALVWLALGLAAIAVFALVWGF